MAHQVVAFAGSPRRHGNTEEMLDAALEGVTQAAPDAVVKKFILNEMTFRPCQNCGFCNVKGYCRFAADDDMGPVYAALDEADRFLIASPIYFATVSAQLKAMIDRCQAVWARKYVLKQSAPLPPRRRALFLSCGGFDTDRFLKCARQVVAAWCVCLDITLSEHVFFPKVDAKGDIRKHTAALDECREAGKRIVSAE